MCGLAGIVLRDAAGIDRATLERRGAAMAATVKHRGPDGWGSWTDGKALLVHTRLAIIDTSDNAAQPMHDETGSVHVIFNGEIYNFRALRDELAAAGYRFRNRSDTEILVHGYRAWGTALFSRLVGMFAVAIWDSRQDRLVLARDRFGEKPLYYMERPDGLLFGSEIKAILAWPGVPRLPDYGALDTFLSLGFTLGPGTAFAGIARLQPGHFLVCPRGKPPVVERYWSLPAPGDNRLTNSSDDLKHELIDRVRAAVEMCLVSDVPLGAFLSGGVDSSAVVAMMARARGGAVETFSSGFGFEDDERRFAADVAGRYGTNHRAFNFGAGVLKNMSRLAWHYDQPFSDSSALVTYALSGETRRSVTVALTGDGADENFLGYARYFRYGAMRRATPPEGARRLGELYGTSADATDAADAYGFQLEVLRENQRLAGYDLALLPYLDRCAYDRFSPLVGTGLSHEEQAGRFDVATYLPDDLLVKVDIAAMAHGLETRAPFLNHELAEWVARIPAERKIWNGEGKALLKAALEPYLPHDCLYRTKIGFRVPLARFLRDDIRKQVEAMLLGERFLDRRIMRRAFVADLLADHRDGVHNHGRRLWTLMALEMWFRTWIDGDGDAPLAGDDDPFASFEPANAERGLMAAKTDEIGA